MGCSYYAYTIIGIRVDRSSLFKEKRRRTCRCDVDDLPRYCPKCGEKFEEFYDEPISDSLESDKLGKFDVVCGDDEDPKEYFIGYVSTVNFNHDMIAKHRPVPNASDEFKLRQEIFELMESFGVDWNKDSFGIWTVGKVNC